MQTHGKYVGLLLVAALFVTTQVWDASALTISPGQGVTIDQVDLRGGADSSIGQITIDRSLLNLTTSMSSGFVNVYDGSNWVVQNLPVFDLLQSDANTISTNFNFTGAADGLNISGASLSIDYSAAPTTFYTGPLSSWSVGNVDNAVGGGADPVSGYRAGPDLSDVIFNFSAPGLGGLVYQFGHPNVQAARNQCAPAAVANSLTWLKNTQGLAVPDPNNPGIRTDNPNNTLVGKLEQAMNRNVTSRTVGDGVWPLDGKLKYLNDTGLDANLDVKHVGGGANNTAGGDGAGGTLDGDDDYTAHGVTSEGQGALTWAWIQNELANGEDVELEFYYVNGGAHYVEVTGAGTILGVPFITHVSDQAQTDVDANDNKGTDKVQFDFLVLKAGKLFLTNENAYALQAISQSIKEVPEPATALLATGGLLMMLKRRQPHC
ncbi:MAG: PEP-CTERM sorting domain-containing protein [Phycisphaeraceae bacterium]|nr:PEP-CTERM sorting domain-containing protein [Phycisphaeraceae bacterium]